MGSCLRATDGSKPGPRTEPRSRAPGATAQEMGTTFRNDRTVRRYPGPAARRDNGNLLHFLQQREMGFQGPRAIGRMGRAFSAVEHDVFASNAILTKLDRDKLDALYKDKIAGLVRKLKEISAGTDRLPADFEIIAKEPDYSHVETYFSLQEIAKIKKECIYYYADMAQFERNVRVFRHILNKLERNPGRRYSEYQIRILVEQTSRAVTYDLFSSLLAYVSSDPTVFREQHAKRAPAFSRMAVASLRLLCKTQDFARAGQTLMLDACSEWPEITKTYKERPYKQNLDVFDAETYSNQFDTSDMNDSLADYYRCFLFVYRYSHPKSHMSAKDLVLAVYGCLQGAHRSESV